MKAIVITITGLLTFGTACAQSVKESDVPASVKTAFAKKYPNAKAKWEKEDANYEAEFETGETDQSVVLDATGAILETEVEIKTSELPAAATEYISKNYKDAKLKEAARITDAQGVVTYEAEIKGKDLIFDSTGKFIKEELNHSKEKD